MPTTDRLQFPKFDPIGKAPSGEQRERVAEIVQQDRESRLPVRKRSQTAMNGGIAVSAIIIGPASAIAAIVRRYCALRAVSPVDAHAAQGRPRRSVPSHWAGTEAKSTTASIFTRFVPVELASRKRLVCT